jgi:hypothetical protein
VSVGPSSAAVDGSMMDVSAARLTWMARRMGVRSAMDGVRRKAEVGARRSSVSPSRANMSNKSRACDLAELARRWHARLGFSNGTLLLAALNKLKLKNQTGAPSRPVAHPHVFRLHSQRHSPDAPLSRLHSQRHSPDAPLSLFDLLSPASFFLSRPAHLLTFITHLKLSLHLSRRPSPSS